MKREHISYRKKFNDLKEAFIFIETRMIEEIQKGNRLYYIKLDGANQLNLNLEFIRTED